MAIDNDNVQKQIKAKGEDIRLQLEQKDLAIVKLEGHKSILKESLEEAIESIRSSHSCSFSHFADDGKEITDCQIWEHALEVDELTPLEESKLLIERLETLWHKLLQEGYEEFSLSGTPHLIESETGLVIGPFPGNRSGIGGGKSSGGGGGRE